MKKQTRYLLFGGVLEDYFLIGVGSLDEGICTRSEPDSKKKKKHKEINKLKRDERDRRLKE